MHTCACAARVTVVGSVCVSVTRHLTSRVFVRSSHKDTVSGTAHVFTYACASQLQCAEGLHFSAFHLHIGLFTFHAITFERSSYMKIHNEASVAMNPLVSLFCCLVARSSRKRGNRQTDGRTDDRHTYELSTVTLAAHVRRGLTKE